MRLIGAVLVFTAFAWCGFKISQALKFRCDFLERFITALEILKTEIAFSGADLKTAFENAARISGADIFSCAALYIEKEGIASAWKKAVHQAAVSDKELILLLSSKLGKTDAKGQIRHIEYVSGLVSEARKEAVKKYEGTGSLCRRGGVLLGIFAVLILI